MRPAIAVCAAFGVMTLLVTPATATGQGTDAKPGVPTEAPAGPNPYLAYLPDPATADYAGWRKWLAAKGDERADLRAQR